jgi:hypothetical protein
MLQLEEIKRKIASNLPLKSNLPLEVDNSNALLNISYVYLYHIFPKKGIESSISIPFISSITNAIISSGLMTNEVYQYLLKFDPSSYSLINLLKEDKDAKKGILLSFIQIQLSSSHLIDISRIYPTNISH